MTTPDDASTGSGQKTDNSTVPEHQEPHVTVISPLIGGELRSRGPFISRHRIELDRIKTDAATAKSYPVPYDDDEDDDGGSSPPKKFKLANVFCKKSPVPSNMTGTDWLSIFLPCWLWLKDYKWKSTITSDLMAGLTVGVMVIPQGMSYAKLAGLPVEYGLYSALVPVYAYALFGSSRQLAVGPVALVSLMLATGLTPIVEGRGLTPEDPEYQTQYNTLAIQTSMLVGAVYIAMGLARLGFITIFLSHAVISGFTTGAAVIIGSSQLKYIFGYPIEKSDNIIEILSSLIENIEQFNWKTFLMGTLSILLLMFLKNVGRHFPKFKWTRAMGPLTVTVIAIVLVATVNLQDKGIPIVGSIPPGLPSFSVNEWGPINDFGKLFVVVISIAIVGFMESVAIAKQLAAKHKYEIDPSLELIGLGMANFFGGMFQAYPITGSFSRSAVNNDSGAKSGIAAIITATLVLLVLLLLTSVFELLPLNTLGAIVISGVVGLLDYDEAIKLWKVHKFDFSVWLIACLGTMFLGVEIGLVIAVAVSLLIVIYESAYPHTAVLGRLPGSAIYRNIKQYPKAEMSDGLLVVRVDAPLYFANAQNVRDKIRKYRLRAERELAEGSGAELKYIIIEMTPVSHIDMSALHILEDMLENYHSRGQKLCFSHPSLTVMQRLVASGFADRAGREHFFSCVGDAVSYCLSQMDIEAHSENCSENNEQSSGIGEEVPWDGSDDKLGENNKSFE